jgi:hypothetical protein
MAESTVSLVPREIRDSDVLLALGKAKACHELLDGIKQGGVVLENDDSRAWVEQIALNALEDALDQAEAEFVKCANALRQ